MIVHEIYATHFTDSKVIELTEPLVWVSVKERKPELNETVLVHYMDGTISTNALIKRKYPPYEIKYKYAGPGLITHWMKIPKFEE